RRPACPRRALARRATQRRRRTRPDHAATLSFLTSFAAVAVGLGAARAATTTYVPVLLQQIADRPALIGLAMLSNALAGFVVPLIAGAYADRGSSRAALILGGVAIASGGLVAVALGNASTYVVLTLAAAGVYVGLNVAQTAHRTLIPERFEDGARPRAISAQELAQLAGALAGTVIGGILVVAAPGALFVAVAAIVVLTAVPTVRLAEVRRAAPPIARERREKAGLAAALRRPGARELLVAQALWVMAYVGIAPFFALYAGHVLGLGPATAGVMLAAFGLLTAAGMLLAARVAPGDVRAVLGGGAALLGVGLTLAATGSRVSGVAAPFALAAVGAGIVTSLGFAYYSRFIPAGETGRYSGAFFAVRAVAATVAVPLAGLTVELSGSYRGVLALGPLALVAVAPILMADRSSAVAARRPLRRVIAVIPAYRSDRFADVATAARAHVAHVVLVDDGAPERIGSELASFAAASGMTLVQMGANRGKGSAVAAGVEAALALRPQPDAVLVLDSDGQHPPERIPAFIDAAGDADVVIGNRRDHRSMPAARRAANTAASFAISLATRHRLPDSQNGMRLIRTDVARRVPFPAGRYEAESRHLKDLVRARARIAWVDIPAVYDGEPSDFRPARDALRVAREIVMPRRPARALLWRSALVEPRSWLLRLASMVLLGWAGAAALRAFQPLDERMFVLVNGLGDGPQWLYAAIDPHSRNYALLTALVVMASIVARRQLRHVAGAAFAVVLAAFAADLVLEVIQLAYDRPRPEEVFGAQADLSHERSWAHIPSFPSGHLVVTAAMVAAAGSAVRSLRYPLLAYLAVVAITRVAFGAHFPLDVAFGAVIGWQVGLVAVAVAASMGFLPAACPRLSLVPGLVTTPSTPGSGRLP
ncbi:MAG TPA: MFS transporter, partial [Solirubrobacteraceae bacterium]|nr:MFS transporter [Solirubrobacteraceae bacterium]